MRLEKATKRVPKIIRAILDEMPNNPELVVPNPPNVPF
jgi:hypothetical protein